MKVNREELLNCLKVVSAGLASKEVIGQSTSFIYQAGQVVTFNDEIAVHHPLPTGMSLEGAVPAKELLAILSRFKGEEVEVILTDNELQLKSGKSKAGIKLEAEITLPMDELMIPDKWKKLPSDFIEGLQACFPSAAKDMTNRILTSIHLTNVRAESSDDTRLSAWQWKKQASFGNGVLLPADYVPGLSKANVTDYAIENGWGHFCNKEGVVFSCRVMDGDFPDIAPHLDIDDVGELEFPDTMIEMLDRAGVFLTGMIDSDNSVTIKVSDKGIVTVKGEGEFGWYEESCRAKWNGSEVGFSIHPSHLQSILKTANVALVGVDKIKFLTDQFTHIVVLEEI